MFSGKKQFSRLPQEISENWLESLPLVKPPADSVHYRGKQLQSVIKQLSARLDNDDPLEEYKVMITDYLMPPGGSSELVLTVIFCAKFHVFLQCSSCDKLDVSHLICLNA